MTFAQDLYQSLTPHDASKPLHLRNEAANDATRVITLDALVAQHGTPTAGQRMLTFAGYDPAVSLALGQKVASERILRAVPGFVQSAAQSWVALTPAQRARVVGFAPNLLPVLLGETLSLRDLNDRYDRAARIDALSRARAVSNADSTERDARHLYADAYTMVGEYMSAAQWSSLGFATLPASPADLDRLTLALDTLAAQIGAWQTTLAPEMREACDEINLGDALVHSLRVAAEDVRRTQSELAGLTATTRVTQRQLDTQDGRVLHVVRMIYTAFRLAARHDRAIVVPDLGEIESVFVRDRRPTADAPDDATDTTPTDDTTPDDTTPTDAAPQPT